MKIHIKEINSVEGQLLKSQKEIKQEAHNHFQAHFTEEGPINEAINEALLQEILRVISKRDNEVLFREIEEQEVVNAIWDIEPNKAPGPDGFSIHFYKACWPLIKFDLCKMLNWTKAKCKIGGSTNSSFLALVLKEANPSNFQDSGQ